MRVNGRRLSPNMIPRPAPVVKRYVDAAGALSSPRPAGRGSPAARAIGVRNADTARLILPFPVRFGYLKRARRALATNAEPRRTGDDMKRWWLTVVLAAIAIGLLVYLILRPDETARLVAEYGRDNAVGPRVVELGPSAVAPLCEALEGLPASDLSEADKQAIAFDNLRTLLEKVQW